MTFPDSCSSSWLSWPLLTLAWIDSRSLPPSSSSTTRASARPGSIASSTSTTAGSGSYSTSTSPTASAAVVLGLGDDERDGLPSEDDLRAGERLRRTVRPTSRDGEVVRAKDGDHPRRSERRVAVDVPDERVRSVERTSMQEPAYVRVSASGLPW